MEIKTSQQGFIEKVEVEEIIKEYLKSKGLDAVTISFSIRNETEKDDCLAQFPTIPMFKGIHFETKQIN